MAIYILMKSCSLCKSFLPSSDFYFQKRWVKNDGFPAQVSRASSHCKSCVKSKVKNYRDSLDPEERNRQKLNNNNYNRERRKTPEYKAKQADYYEKTKERQQKYQKEYYERIGRQRKGFSPRQPARKLTYEDYVRRQRDNTLKSKYGITIDDYERMFESQNGVCLICGKPPTGNTTTKMLAVDHCHKTGLVRGLLCHKHNSAIGLLDDDIELVRAALRYLEKF